MAIQVRQQLLGAVKKINRPGTFCVSGELPATLPGLEVAGIGPIALPLGKGQAAAVKKQARQAPYGKGTQTLVDTGVRRVWEIDADQFTLANPQWPAVLDQAVRAVRSELGLEKHKLAAHLYKLLLYEPGSFFRPHRDGEKLDGMVATLVVALPSAHEGGQLVVRHEGRERTIDFGPRSRFHTQFAGFYSDCEHEIRPVTSGFRLTLVYNLTLEKPGKAITAPSTGEHLTALARVLSEWSSRRRKVHGSQEGSSASKLAVLLDHQYTQAGLRHSALKGADRAKADVLFSAASQAGCDASLALVTYWESGSAEWSGEYDRYDRYGRYGYASGDQGQHAMEEVFDQSLTAEHFSDVEDNPLAFGQIPLKEAEIVSQVPLKEGEPDKEDFEGYTGNEGMTLERWYHRAAIVIWPAELRFDVLCEAGTDAAVGGLQSMVKQWGKARKSEQAALKQPCLDFARRIIAHWPERPLAERWNYRISPDSGKAPLLPLLEKLADPSLISAWVCRVLARDVTVDPGKELGDICQEHGWLAFQDELGKVFDSTSNETLERHARLLADFALRKDNDADRKILCAHLARQMMSAVERWDPRRAKRNWEGRAVDLAKLLPPLARSFIILDEPELLDRLVSYVLGRPNEFDLTTVQVPALLGFEDWLARNVKHPCPPLRRWLMAAHEELESRAAHPPQEPTDWRREPAAGCKCALCQELNRFLDDPTARTLRLPLAKERRQHLHQIIERGQLDTTHATERRGRPYTLVCTKIKASYERAFKAHHVDLDQLAKVDKLLAWHESLSA